MARWEGGTPQRLQQAALDLFATRGYEQTTAAEIAESVRLTERTFFRHFSDKREVLFYGQDEFVRAFLAGVHSAPPDGEARALMLGSIDAIVAEGLSGSAALHELLGPSDTLGGALSMLVELFLGNSPPAARSSCRASPNPKSTMTAYPPCTAPPTPASTAAPASTS